MERGAWFGDRRVVTGLEGGVFNLGGPTGDECQGSRREL